MRRQMQFYTALFGWSREEMDMPGYTYSMFKSGDRAVCGMFTLPPEAASMPVMDALRDGRSLEASVARAKELGTVHKDITTIQMGRFAMLADPQGAVIGLWQFTS